MGKFVGDLSKQHAHPASTDENRTSEQREYNRCTESDVKHSEEKCKSLDDCAWCHNFRGYFCWEKPCPTLEDGNETAGVEVEAKPATAQKLGEALSVPRFEDDGMQGVDRMFREMDKLVQHVFSDMQSDVATEGLRNPLTSMDLERDADGWLRRRQIPGRGEDTLSSVEDSLLPMLRLRRGAPSAESQDAKRREKSALVKPDYSRHV